MRGVRPEYAEAKAAVPSNVIPFVSSKRTTALSIPARRQVGIEGTLTETDELKGGKDWSTAEPRHFLGLYFRLHQVVHQVEPGELLEPRTWKQAIVEVAYVLTREFRGDKDQFAHFLAWTWARERAGKARSPHWRTGWRRQFSAALVTDYRIAMKVVSR